MHTQQSSSTSQGSPLGKHDLQRHSSEHSEVGAPAADSETTARQFPEEMLQPFWKKTPEPARPFQLRRFAGGLLLSTCGMVGVLSVVSRLVAPSGIPQEWLGTLVAVGVLLGVMLVGGGFGIMATSMPRHDDGEFERLIQLGEQGLPTPRRTSFVEAEGNTADEASNVPVGTGSGSTSGVNRLPGLTGRQAAASPRWSSDIVNPCL